MLLLILPYNLKFKKTESQVFTDLALQRDFNVESFEDEFDTIAIPCPINFLAYYLSKDDDIYRCITVCIENLSKLSAYKLKQSEKKLYILDKGQNQLNIPQCLFSDIVTIEDNISPIYKMLAQYILENHDSCRQVLSVLHENIENLNLNKSKEQIVYDRVRQVKDTLFNIRKEYAEKEYIFSELKKMIESNSSYSTIKAQEIDIIREKKHILDLLHYTEESLENSLKEKSKLSELLNSISNDKNTLEEKLEKINNERCAHLYKLANYTSRLFSESKKFRKEIKLQEEILKNSELFDSNYYLNSYPDLECFQGSLELHYLLYGAVEGRNPSNSFVTYFYLNKYKDVRESALNPLIHYIKYGLSENRIAF